jgi:hypothetical protein
MLHDAANHLQPVKLRQVEAMVTSNVRQLHLHAEPLSGEMRQNRCSAHHLWVDEINVATRDAYMPPVIVACDVGKLITLSLVNRM